MAVKGFIPSGQTIGEILNDTKRYVVPKYQRDYSWEKIHIETFWNDLIDNIGNKGGYFFGSVIFQSLDDDNNKIIVIDGQQRLATITLLLSVIRDIFYGKDINSLEDAAVLQQLIIKDRFREEKINKLTLNIRNKKFFYHCIQLDPKKDKDSKTFDEYNNEFGQLSKTNQLIKEAYDFFSKKINERLEKMNEREEKIEYLTNMVKHVSDYLAIMTITVSNVEDAYMVFETINERGIELTVADLFKNYLISKSKNKDEMVEIWNNIFEILDNKIRGFLKHYWQSKNAVVLERRLFRKLKDFVEDKRNRVDVDVLTKEIEGDAYVYSSLQNPDSDYWMDKNIKELLRDFNVLGVVQPLPLLLVGKLHFSNNEFRKLLELMINFTFRYNTICNFPPNALEKMYSDLSIRIRKKEIIRTNEIIDELKTLDHYPTDTIFRNTFYQKKSIKNVKIARYILKKIDMHRFSIVDKKKESTEPFDYDNFTLEHILPKKLNDEWKKHIAEIFSVRETMEYVNNLGNLTLLDEWKNNFIQNEFIDKKCEKAYNLSHLKINDYIKNRNSWDIEHINERQGRFADDAMKIWVID